MFLNYIFTVGNYDDLSDKESKRVVLLNKITLLGILSHIVLGVIVIFIDTENLYILPPFHLAEVFLLSSIFIWQKLRWYQFSRVLLWVVTYIFIFFLSHYIKTDVHNDYYFGVLALLPLLFFDSRIITYIGLTLSILGFYALSISESFVSEKYGISSQTNTAINLFIIIFLIVNYFKTLNEKNEKSLEKKSKELEKLNSFQSQFFINISHEIRTPLTLIQGNSELLSEHPVTSYNPEVQQYNAVIQKQTSNIKKIVDDVIDLSKMNTNEFLLQKKTILLNDFLKRLHFSFQATFEQKGIIFRYENTSKNCTIYADTIYLERALNNILLNALKYTNTGGEVTLKFFIENNQNVVISIQDTGIGIAKEHLPKIFDRFYRASNSINKAGGSGIGLAFSKEVILMHEGNIKVRSEENLGSEFKIILPIITIETELSNTSEISSTNTSKNLEIHNSPISSISKNHILIVDDHDEMRKYIQNLLHGYVCYHAQDGIEALELLKQRNIDYIITDYMMPNMDGYQFIKEIKNQHITTPILMLTARGDINDKLNVLRLGIDDYLTKPFNKNELIIRINNALINNNEKEKFALSEQLHKHTSNYEAFLMSLKDFISIECNKPEFGIENIVTEFAISKSSLYRKIKSSTGLTPNEFISEIKLQKARVMIELNQVNSLKQLSFAVGFTKPSYFSKLYEKRFGSKPFSKE